MKPLKPLPSAETPAARPLCLGNHSIAVDRNVTSNTPDLILGDRNVTNKTLEFILGNVSKILAEDKHH